MTSIPTYNILIADDQKENFLLLNYILERLPENYNTIYAANGKEAIEKTISLLPDLIFMDWKMPIMGGLESVKQIKSRADTKDIPIIMITAMTLPENLEEAFNVGVIDFLRKPVERTEITARLRSALRLHDSYKKIKLQNQLIEQKNHEIRQVNEELQSLNQLKDKLFSVLSHDLKGPLHTLTLFLETFIGNAEIFTKEEVIYYSKEIKKSLKNVSELLENLLKWSRLQMGNVEFEPEVYAVEETVKRNVELLQPMAQRKQQDLSYKFYSGSEVFADKNMLDFIIRNLISNAIKFTDIGGQIEISIKTLQNCVKIDVADNGIGIDPEKKDTLFDSKHILTAVGTKEEQGTGLGLILCKEYTVKNNGKISVESQLGKGSVFSILLPSPEFFE